MCLPLFKEPVVNQQAATPTPSLHSTEARVEAAAAINSNADQLTAIPRRLQNPSKSGLQCWVIVNSTMGNHGCHSGKNYEKLFWLTVHFGSNYFYVSLCHFIWLQRFVLLAPSAPVPSRFLTATTLRFLCSCDFTVLPDCLGLLCPAVPLCSSDLQSELLVNSLWDLAPVLLCVRPVIWISCTENPSVTVYIVSLDEKKH